MTHAEAFLQSGNSRDAEALARRIYESGATPQATDLLRRAEAALLGELTAAYMEGGQKPGLLLDTEQLRQVPLTAPERYLLSRMNGARELSAIVRVSPIKPLEALKLVQKFVEQGWISL
jgi:hypothetical protein